ncbi:hypothetical protein [Vulcanisaeta sp. JCM 16159]|uniref:hypothetical protein n=1 Tax=Vulcanisaeta sp. JCM 16159 TaxID=1295371 RepID=UPI001FB325BD|nr:hypothetical protein [Vulcanisaeta sp. JCM 16159]
MFLRAYGSAAYSIRDAARSIARAAASAAAQGLRSAIDAFPLFLLATSISGFSMRVDA